MSILRELESAFLRIPLEDVKQATNNFAAENFIGRDDFGKAYKGNLLQPEGFVTVVFTRLELALGQGGSEFWKELTILSTYKHENIVSLIGFSNESDEIILVHDFLIHGSLDKYLTSTQLTWFKRLKICLGAAHGLNYLHCPPGTKVRVVHRDMNSANILLDKNWQAKIANVGLSRYGQTKPEFHYFWHDTGTNGYVDPLYMETGLLSKESDIYSFGVILFEVLCGRLAITKDGADTQILSRLACHYYENGTLTQIINPILIKQMNQDSFNVFSTIAYQCLKKNRHERPTSMEVVAKLEEALRLQHEYEKALALQQEDVAHLKIPLEDIEEATNNFAAENLTGIDDFGKAYKGALSRPEGIVTVSFKRLDIALDQGSMAGFRKEIMLLSRYRHENIVSLVGFSNERDEMILVHEIPTYGGLDKYLSSAKLTWLKRLHICLGAARGLHYLHNPPETQMSITHRDMKSENILLDENWQAKIANFGLSKIGPEDQEFTFFVSDAVGTIGYTDPLYIETGILSKESDMYSFGVILFEVLCGRLAIRKDGDDIQDLSRLAHSHYENSNLIEIIDPILRKQMSPDSLDIFSGIAYQCLKRDRAERPTIFEVVEKLEEVLGLQQDYEKALALQQVGDKLKDKRGGEDDFSKVKNLEHMKIPLEDIKLATHGFHDDFVIGSGGFGKVYKAKLFHFDFKRYVNEKKFQRVSIEELSSYPRRQSAVAIKRLDRKFGQDFAEFLQEISVLAYFTHKNLVTLVGFCDEDHENILVYEYASNGSLDEHVQSSDSHTWATRLQICLDAASGLEFLHNGVGEHYRIIHRDIKSSNILLGRNYIGMISDLGLSRIGPANWQPTFVMTQVAGTLEYIDPQYHKTGKLTKKSDVYSFGVVLFEALSGRLARFRKSKGDPEFLPHMAKRCFEQKNINEIIDSKFKKEFEKVGSSIIDDETCPDSINIFAAIAYKCLKEKREDRPTMADVVKELEKAFKSHVKGVEALRTTLDDVRFATNNFHDIKEQGPLGEVYYGELSHFKGQKTVTIKRLYHSVGSHGEEFCKEVGVLYNYRHENIVPVLGFCEEQGERIIVYEHMVKGSLKDHLTNTSLTWKQRLKICVDAAYGIAYIHSHAGIENLIHGDIKSSSILLRDDWKAVISDFIIFKGAGTLGYQDPVYATTSSLTQKSDVYSFGVVLFEILSGRLAIERIKINQQQPLHELLDFESQLNNPRGRGEGERMVFLAQLAVKCFKTKKLEDIIFHGIKKEIEPISLVTFSTVAYQCLLEQQEDRPTMAKVVEELEKAFNFQDEWEWEQKLPSDYKEIIQISKCPLPSTITNKDLYSLLSSGILLDNEKVWFSIRMDGSTNEMVSAKRFSYPNGSSLKWRSVQNSRFPKGAKIFNISNLNIGIQITTRFLTPQTTYGAYLVFQFCDRRKVSNKPLYVNLKYKNAGQSLNAYFAEWKDGSKWLTIELFRFSSIEGSTDFKVLLESFSEYYCGRGGILVEGIEFQAIRRNKEFNDETNVGGALKTKWDMNWGEQMVVDYKNIIKRSGNNVQHDAVEELYIMLSKGILIDNGEKFFSLSKVNGKKCQTLPAKAIIYNSSNVKFCKPPTGSRCIFSEVVEILSHQDFRIKCDIEMQLLSTDTTYACFLLFQLSTKCSGLKCPVKARDLVPNRKERTKIISFTSPSTMNMDKIKWLPQQREDGWMEVRVWETFIDNIHNNEYVHMDLKLISFEGTMSGLIVCGIEFRPIDIE